MSIQFHKLRWKNFLSTGNEFIEIELDAYDTNLIVGKNGNGKSTILDSLSFALYGKPYRNINKPQLVNSITNKNCLVEVEFTIKKNQYLVRRGLKPAIFEVYRNDALIEQNASARDYQEYFEKNVLQINHRSFTQIVMIGSANYTPFMQLRTHERRAVIEDILDIEIFTRMYDTLRERVSTNKNELSDTKYKIDLLNEKITLTQKHINEINAIHLSDRKNKEEQIESLKGENSQIDDKLLLAKTELDKINDRLDEIEKIEKKIDRRATIFDSLRSKRLSILEEIEQIEHRENCPTCEQKITSAFKESRISEKKEKLSTIEHSTVEMGKILNEYHSQITDKDNLVREQSDLKKVIFDFVNVANYNRKKITELEDAINKVVPIVNEDVEVLRKELKTETHKYQSLLEQRQRYDIATTLLKDGGIKTQIIKQYVPVINKLMNSFLSAMDFFVQFELDENFNESIKSRYRDEFTYESFSEGEKARLNLCLLLTWRAIAKMRNSTSMNLLILDEVFDGSLDDDGIGYLTNIISTHLSDSNVFIISHKTDQMIDRFSNVLLFEKVKNFSKLKRGNENGV